MSNEGGGVRKSNRSQLDTGGGVAFALTENPNTKVHSTPVGGDVSRTDEQTADTVIIDLEMPDHPSVTTLPDGTIMIRDDADDE